MWNFSNKSVEYCTFILAQFKMFFTYLGVNRLFKWTTTFNINEIFEGPFHTTITFFNAILISINQGYWKKVWLGCQTAQLLMCMNINFDVHKHQFVVQLSNSSPPCIKRIDLKRSK